MMNGAKKGQKPKKPIKQKPVKAFTGLEIAAIGALAGMAGSQLMGGGKQSSSATPLNNPAAMIAPLSGFVGKEEDKEKAPGMKKGGAVKMKIGGMGLLGAGADLLERSQGARDVAKNLGIGPKLAADYYQDKEDDRMSEMNKPKMKMGGLSGGKRYGAPPKKGPMSQGMKDGGMTYNDKMGMEGGSSMGQKDIQVKKKVFKGIF